MRFGLGLGGGRGLRRGLRLERGGLCFGLGLGRVGLGLGGGRGLRRGGGGVRVRLGFGRIGRGLGVGRGLRRGGRGLRFGRGLRRGRGGLCFGLGLGRIGRGLGGVALGGGGLARSGGLTGGALFGRDGARTWARGGGRCIRCFGMGAQQQARLHDPRLDPPLDRGFGDAVQHLGVGGGRLGTEKAVFGGEIPEIFRDRPHRFERLVKAFQGTGEGAIGHRQDLVCVTHGSLLCSTGLIRVFTRCCDRAKVIPHKRDLNRAFQRRLSRIWATMCHRARRFFGQTGV